MRLVERIGTVPLSDGLKQSGHLVIPDTAATLEDAARTGTATPMTAQPGEPDIAPSRDTLAADNADLTARNDSLEQQNSDLTDANTALRLEVTGLEQALTTNRDIGAAVGIVMERLHLTQDEAFAFLVRTSQNLNLKLGEVGDRIVHTGELTLGE